MERVFDLYSRKYYREGLTTARDFHSKYDSRVYLSLSRFIDSLESRIRDPNLEQYLSQCRVIESNQVGRIYGLVR